MTPSITPIELHGTRALLRPLQESDAEALFDAGRPPEIWRYMPQHPQTLDDMRRIVRETLAAQSQGLEMTFVIFDQQTDRIVGSTRLLDISLPNRHWEIGWTWLTPDVWRTRLNTECKYLLLRHSFETMGMIRVSLKTDARNLRSQQAIERLGATKEGVWRRHRILPDGYIRDTVYYSIIAEEWPTVKQRLEGFLANADPTRL
jgi:RimJ/RimL family protein N-acetyltransferase